MAVPASCATRSTLTTPCHPSAENAHPVATRMATVDEPTEIQADETRDATRPERDRDAERRHQKNEGDR